MYFYYYLTHLQMNFADAEISNLKNQISELQNKVKDAGEVIDILEKKLGEAEAEAHALKNYEEKKVEIDILKTQLKKWHPG